MNLKIEIDEKDLQDLILQYLQTKTSDLNLTLKDIKIQVKSKQNYKSEWEEANFRAVVDRHEI